MNKSKRYNKRNKRRTKKGGAYNAVRYFGTRASQIGHRARQFFIPRKGSTIQPKNEAHIQGISEGNQKNMQVGVESSNLHKYTEGEKKLFDAVQKKILEKYSNRYKKNADVSVSSCIDTILNQRLGAHNLNRNTQEMSYLENEIFQDLIYHYIDKDTGLLNNNKLNSSGLRCETKKNK
jgi:hypothetical protein